MIVNSINDYLGSGLPCLHFHTKKEGIELSSIRDCSSVLMTVYQKQLTNNEINLLQTYPIEIGIVAKKDLFFLIFKIGPDSDPFIFDYPFDPNFTSSYGIVDKWINSTLFTIAITVDENPFEKKYNVPIFRFFRILSIPLDLQLHVGSLFVNATNLGNYYSNDFFEWIENEIQHLSAEDRWKIAEKIGELEE